jgi:hypothetical protein
MLFRAGGFAEWDDSTAAPASNTVQFLAGWNVPPLPEQILA